MPLECRTRGTVVDMATNTVEVRVRIPADLHARLKDAAESDFRNLTSFILATLRDRVNEGSGK